MSQRRQLNGASVIKISSRPNTLGTRPWGVLQLRRASDGRRLRIVSGRSRVH